MKKIAVIVLTLIYTASVYGVTISKFYCCGKLAEVSLSASFQSQTGCKANGPACCKTIKANYKVKDNHFSAQTNLALKNSFTLIRSVLFIPGSPAITGPKEIKAYNSQAPPVRRDPLYIRYSNFRI